jgi:hypothetical protein
MLPRADDRAGSKSPFLDFSRENASTRGGPIARDARPRSLRMARGTRARAQRRRRTRSEVVSSANAKRDRTHRPTRGVCASTVERTRRDVCREPRPWCARARLRAIVSSDTSRRTSDRLFRADAESYRASRRVVGAYRVPSRWSPRIRVRDARASSPAAPRLDPHRLTSPVSFPSSRVSRPIDAGRRQARRGDRADQREAPGPAFLSAGRRHHRMGPVPGRRRVLHRLQSRLGRCADRTRDARTSPFFALVSGTRKNAHRIPYASLERSLPSDEETPRTFSMRLDRRGGVRARRGHDPRVVRGG